MKDYMKFFRGTHKFGYEGAKTLVTTPLTCGYCGEHVAPSKGYCVSQDTRDIAYIYECPHCRNPIIYFTFEQETIPGAMYGREVKSLPENIQALYDECRTCYANQCYTSAQMIARTLLMHIAVEQGAEPGWSFAKYVNYLEENGYIPPNGKKWVDFIRISGNVANHEIVIKERAETEKVITFLSTLLLVIYELPSSLED